MIKEKRILSYAIGYLLVGLFICLIGISNVFASTYYLDYSYSQKYFDNNGSSVTGVTTTWNESLQSYVSGNITTAAGSYGAGLSITSPIPILENHTYTLSIYFEEINNIALSSKNYLAFSSTLQGAANNYANGEYENDLITSSVSNNSILNFAFTSKRNGTYIFIPWTTTSTVTQDYVLTQIQMEDLGSEGVSIDDINTSLTNQTNELNTSIQNSTNTITGAINDTEENINSNIDDMEDSINSTIKDNFNSCRDSYNLYKGPNTYTNNGITFIKNEDGTYNISGTSTANANAYSWVSIEDSKLIDGETYIFYVNQTLPEGVHILAEQYNGTTWKSHIISGINSSTKSNYKVIDLTDTTQIRFGIRVNEGFTVDVSNLEISLVKGSAEISFEPYGKQICSNKIDETNDKLEETNQNLNDIEGALTDDSSIDMSSLGDTAGWLPAGPVDSIINIPFTMLNALSTSLSGSCVPLTMNLPFVNNSFTFPCISDLLMEIEGFSTFWNWLGAIASVIILYKYLMNLYAWVDDILMMRVELDEAMGCDMANWGRL